MILGERANLDAQAQERVAAWAIKTAAMTQLARSSPESLRDELRVALYERHVAPQECRVWIAAWTGMPNPTARARLRGFPVVSAEDPTVAVPIEAATIAIGQLVLQTFSEWSGPGLEIEPQLPAEIEQFVSPIWPEPSDEATWPRTRVLNGRDSLQNFADFGEPEQLAHLAHGRFILAAYLASWYMRDGAHTWSFAAEPLDRTMFSLTILASSPARSPEREPCRSRRGPLLDTE